MISHAFDNHISYRGTIWRQSIFLKSALKFERDLYVWLMRVGEWSWIICICKCSR